MAEAHGDEIAKLEALYEENPDGRVFIHLAEAYRRAGELDLALGVLTEGIERHADYSSAHVVLGRVLQDQGRDAEAASAFERVLELDAHNLVALRGLGDVARLGGRTEEALDYYRRLHDLEPGDDDLAELIRALEGAPAAEGPAQPQVAPTVAPAEPTGTEAPEIDRPTPDRPAFVDGPAPLPELEPLEEPGEEAAEAPPIEAFSLSDDTGFDTGHAEVAEAEVLDEAIAPEEPASEEAPADAGADEAAVEEILTEDAVEEAPADASDTGLVAEEAEGGEPPSADVEAMEGFQSAEDVVSAEEVGEVEALDVTVEDYGGALTDAPDEEALPEVVGLEGVETAEGPAGPLAEGEPAAPDLASEEEATRMPGEQAPAEEGVEEPSVEEAGPVYTETMAEVYARQGLYERAIDVYRELLTQRPDDTRLRERLREVEATASAEAAAPGEADVTEEAAVVEAAEPGVEEVVADTAPDDDALPFLEELPATEDETAEEEAPRVAEPLTEPEAEEPEPETGWEPEPAAEGPAEDVVVEVEPPAEPMAAAEEAPSAEDVESVWTGADGAVAGEETPYAWAEPEPAEEAGEAIGRYLHSLASWRGEPGATPPEDSAPPEESTPAEQRDEGSGPPPTGEGDDDDLDMFRAWLESLKR